MPATLEPADVASAGLRHSGTTRNQTGRPRSDAASTRIVPLVQARRRSLGCAGRPKRVGRLPLTDREARRP